MVSILRVALTTLLLLALVAPASAADLTITKRQLPVAGKLDVKAANTLAQKLIKLDAAEDGPVYLMISATAGSAQGVMVVADTIRTMKNPVIGVVLTEVHGTGAALAPFTDRVVMYPSAGFVFTELDYEGVKKPEPPEDEDDASAVTEEEKKKAAAAATKKKKKKPTKEELMLQVARVKYLKRLNDRLAQRMYIKPARLAAAIEAGGMMMTADEAVSKKVAFAIVDRIIYRKLPVEKNEIKVTTTRKEVRQVTPDDDAGTN